MFTLREFVSRKAVIYCGSLTTINAPHKTKLTHFSSHNKFTNGKAFVSAIQSLPHLLSLCPTFFSRSWSGPRWTSTQCSAARRCASGRIGLSSWSRKSWLRLMVYILPIPQSTSLWPEMLTKTSLTPSASTWASAPAGKWAQCREWTTSYWQVLTNTH